MMLERGQEQAIADHWGRQGLAEVVLDALTASGHDLETLTIDDLAPADQFHSGGKAATVRLARLAGLSPGMRVLDVGGGLGGPARTLAVEFGCHVTVVDLTPSYVQAAEMLTARLGLGERVSHRVGNALELPVDAGAFDVVWTQNSGMNIPDKERLYAGFHGALVPGGLLALQEPMAGPVQPPIFPVMWAKDASASFLRSPDDMRRLIGASGFRPLAWEDVTDEATSPGSTAEIPSHSIQRLVMGDGLAEILRSGQRNREERRILLIQAVFARG